MRFSCRSVPVRLFCKYFAPAGFVACVTLLLVPNGFCQRSGTPTQQPDTVPVQDAGQANDRIMQLALADKAKQGDYIIGSGDLLGIEVFDVPELTRDVRVNESGYVSIPLLPVRVQATGLTTFQFQDKVSELLQVNGLVSHPQVTVSVKEQHSAPITIIGAVNKPTTIQAVRQTTLLEALSEAGGISNDAASTVLITRGAEGSGARAANATTISNSTEAGKEDPPPNIISIDLNELLNTGNPQYNIPLLGGDVVTVPRSGVVYVVGAVTHPGGFVMGNDRQQMTVLKVLSLSGGLTPTAKGNEAMIVRQNPTGARQEVAVDLKKILTLKAEDVPLRQSDILFIPDSTSKHALRKSAEIAISLATGAAIVNAGRL